MSKFLGEHIQLTTNGCNGNLPPYNCEYSPKTFLCPVCGEGVAERDCYYIDETGEWIACRHCIGAYITAWKRAHVRTACRTEVY